MLLRYIQRAVHTKWYEQSFTKHSLHLLALRTSSLWNHTTGQIHSHCPQLGAGAAHEKSVMNFPTCHNCEVIFVLALTIAVTRTVSLYEQSNQHHQHRMHTNTVKTPASHAHYLHRRLNRFLSCLKNSDNVCAPARCTGDKRWLSYNKYALLDCCGALLWSKFQTRGLNFHLEIRLPLPCWKSPKGNPMESRYHRKVPRATWCREECRLCQRHGVSGPCGVLRGNNELFSLCRATWRKCRAEIDGQSLSETGWKLCKWPTFGTLKWYDSHQRHGMKDHADTVQPSE